MTVTGVVFIDRMHGVAVGGVPTKGADGGAVAWTTGDGGETWTHRLVTAPGFSFVAVQPGRGIVAITDCELNDSTGCRPGLYSSKDRGSTWQRLSGGRFNSVSFVDPTHGWATRATRAPDGALTSLVGRTSDGGRTWARQPSPCVKFDMEAVGISFVSTSSGWIACAYDVGAGAGAKAILHTKDGGITWGCVASMLIPVCRPRGHISYGGYLSGIAMRPSGIGAVWMGRGVTQKTMDGGSHWSDIPPASFDSVLVNEVTLRTDTDWATSAWNGDLQEQEILRSQDGGQTWQTLAVVPPGQ